MPNENIPPCSCSVAGSEQQSPEGRNGPPVLNTVRGRGSKGDNRPDSRFSNKSNNGRCMRSCDIGGSSCISQQGRPTKNTSDGNKKRSKSSRRTRSAERAESHYIYIDSSGSIASSRIHDDSQGALYVTTPITADTSTNANFNGFPLDSHPVYPVPSMTSPPPTYDVAVAKQPGLPPSYEDYLCHKYAMLSRSHTPPPPWSDSTYEEVDPPNNRCKSDSRHSREVVPCLYTQTDILREAVNATTSNPIFRKHVRQQRLRAMRRRSSSESRAHQQRIATMCEDGAFCMETTVIQSAFENGVAFCSLM